MNCDAGNQSVEHVCCRGITLRRLGVQLGGQGGQITIELPTGRIRAIRRQERVGDGQGGRDPILPIRGQSLVGVENFMIINRVGVLALLCKIADTIPT